MKYAIMGHCVLSSTDTVLLDIESYDTMSEATDALTTVEERVEKEKTLYGERWKHNHANRTIVPELGFFVAPFFRPKTEF